MSNLKIGQVVLVPFGKKNRSWNYLVKRNVKNPNGYEIKRGISKIICNDLILQELLHYRFYKLDR